MEIIRNLIKDGASILPNSESAMLDSELLLCHVLKITREQLYCKLNKTVEHKQIHTYLHLLEQRSTGMPIAYLLNKKEFRSREFFVNESVLVPRPETETLVEEVLKNIDKNEQMNILELGAGSGIISASIAKERPNTSITAVDICYEAIKVTKKNLRKFNISNVMLCVANWFLPLNEGEFFDIIISNPPYVSVDFNKKSADGICYEPKKSLFSNDNGLADLKKIISQAPNLLSKNGKIFLEHGKGQAQEVRTFLEKNKFDHVSTYCDLNKIDRVTTGSKSDNVNKKG